MAHIEKYNRAAVGHLIAHYDRQAENIGNESVDRTRSHLNYNLAAELQPMKQGDFIKQRCSEVKVQKRKDVNVMCTWVLTAPKDLPESEQVAFFKAAFDFMADRYGRENVISAYVHMDETTPHMHFAFVPVVEDKKKGGFKVSAKERIDRKELRSFHQELDQAVSAVLGHSVSILNDATKQGNMTIAELKQATALVAIQEAENQKVRADKRKERAKQEEKSADIDIAIAHQRVSKAIEETDEAIRRSLATKAKAEAMAAEAVADAERKQQRVSDLEAQTQALQDQLSLLQEKSRSLSSEIEQYQSRLQGLQWHFMITDEVDKLQVQKTVFGTLKGITYEECLSLKATAARVEQADKVLSERDKIIASAKSEAEQVISEAKSEAETIVSDAKSKSEEELHSFFRYKDWADKAYKDYSEKAKQKDEMTGQLQQTRERLSEVERQVSSLEQEKDRIQGEIDGLKAVLEQFTPSQENRYCYLTVDSLVYNRLKETFQEHKIAFQAIRTDDGNFAIRAARSEKEYLANAVVQAQKFVSAQNQGQDQTPPPPPKRRTPRR